MASFHNSFMASLYEIMKIINVWRPRYRDVMKHFASQLTTNKCRPLLNPPWIKCWSPANWPYLPLFLLSLWSDITSSSAKSVGLSFLCWVLYSSMKSTSNSCTAIFLLNCTLETILFTSGLKKGYKHECVTNTFFRQCSCIDFSRAPQAVHEV